MIITLAIDNSSSFRWVLSVGDRPAVCVSIVNTTRSSLRQVNSVYGGSNGAAPLLKFITGVHLSHNFDRIIGLCGMVFDLGLMHVQLNMSALTFGTKGIPIEKFGRSFTITRAPTLTCVKEKLNSPEQKGYEKLF